MGYNHSIRLSSPQAQDVTGAFRSARDYRFAPNSHIVLGCYCNVSHLLISKGYCHDARSAKSELFQDLVHLHKFAEPDHTIKIPLPNLSINCEDTTRLSLNSLMVSRMPI